MPRRHVMAICLIPDNKKGIEVLEEIRLGSINKEELLKKELSKRDIGGIATLVFRVVSFLD